LLISQRFPAITMCERQWTGRKARRDRGLAAAPEFIQELGRSFPRMVFPYRSTQYFPKGADLSVYSQAHLNKVARQLNERPRKTLGFETPAEKFNACVASTG
jgi:hypothetical protein